MILNLLEISLKKGVSFLSKLFNERNLIFLSLSFSKLNVYHYKTFLALNKHSDYNYICIILFKFQFQDKLQA